MCKLNKLLKPYGDDSKIDNSNITNELGLFLLKTGKATEEDFETLPIEEGTKKTEKKDKK